MSNKRRIIESNKIEVCIEETQNLLDALRSLRSLKNNVNNSKRRKINLNRRGNGSDKSATELIQSRIQSVTESTADLLTHLNVECVAPTLVRASIKQAYNEICEVNGKDSIIARIVGGILSAPSNYWMCIRHNKEFNILTNDEIDYFEEKAKNGDVKFLNQLESVHIYISKARLQSSSFKQHWFYYHDIHGGRYRAVTVHGCATSLTSFLKTSEIGIDYLKMLIRNKNKNGDDENNMNVINNTANVNTSKVVTQSTGCQVTNDISKLIYET